jgi:pilus assembly protein Flp/PilA
MEFVMHKILLAFAALRSAEEGQDLIEYALLVALVALAATAGMKSLAGAVNSSFTSLAALVGNST